MRVDVFTLLVSWFIHLSLYQAVYHATIAVLCKQTSNIRLFAIFFCITADGIVLICGSVGRSHILVARQGIRATDCSVVVKISGFLDQLFTLMNNIAILE